VFFSIGVAGDLSLLFVTIFLLKTKRILNEPNKTSIIIFISFFIFLFFMLIQFLFLNGTIYLGEPSVMNTNFVSSEGSLTCMIFFTIVIVVIELICFGYLREKKNK
jgi:hypothetical protein